MVQELKIALMWLYVKQKPKVGKVRKKWQEEEIHRRDMEEIIEEEPAVQDDVQDDLVKNIIFS